jgi:hypothetical protein
MTATIISFQEDSVSELMRRYGIPATRENWLLLAYGGHMPEVWTGEHEDSVPPRWRDPSQIGREYEQPIDNRVFPPYRPFDNAPKEKEHCDPKQANNSCD